MLTTFLPQSAANIKREETLKLIIAINCIIIDEITKASICLILKKDRTSSKASLCNMVFRCKDRP